MKKDDLNKKMTKQKSQPEKIDLMKVITKGILGLALFIVLILVTFLFLRNLHYFKLNSIEVVDRRNATQLDPAQLLRVYKNRNIFDIDIVSLSSRIKNDYPAIKGAIVKRILPNSLEIEIIPRIPVAQIGTRKPIFIDNKAMVLSPRMQTGKLPIITGFSVWIMPRIGQIVKNKQLESAIFLIDALKESSMASDYNVTEIDVSNYKNLSFYLEKGIEVKIGGEDFPNRLKKLKKTFDNPDLDKDNIKYIDLRFKDVVIGPK